MIQDPELPPPAPAEAPATPAQGPAAPAAAARPAVSTPSALSETGLERLFAEWLRQQRAARRWNAAFRLAWLVVFVVLMTSLLAQRGGPSPSTSPHTALVEVRGEIAADTEASAEALVGALKQAFQDPGAQGVVLRINSPGGSPVQSGIVNDEIRRLKKLHGKKVYAVVDEVCASGAYYIAVAADEIYVDKASLVGSIGVLMDGFGFTDAIGKLGIERRLITAGENKGMLDPFSPLSARHRDYVKAMIDQIHRQFIKAVRDGRGKRLREDPDTFSGTVWNGEEAVKLGIADAFGSLDHVAREVIKAEEVVDYTPRENVAERLAKRFGAAMGRSVARALREAGPLR